MKTEPVKPRLLITEDNEENRKFLEVYLQKTFELNFCDSAESFYECLNSEHFDVILMVISLNGDKDGLELTRELRSNPKFSDIPVICYTAHVLQQDRFNALEAGCDLYMTKPSDTKILLDSLLSVLSKKKRK